MKTLEKWEQEADETKNACGTEHIKYLEKTITRHVLCLMTQWGMKLRGKTLKRRETNFVIMFIVYFNRLYAR